MRCLTILLMNSIEVGMELFRLFFLGACIGVILNVLWVIYYQIPRMMRKIVDLEDDYVDVRNRCANIFHQLYDISREHDKVLEGLDEKVKSIEESVIEE